ncbi:MAG: glutamine amidotransferase [Ruminococcaceae bacterium]|nr:glutamine amidotransferase [Oscillospiraceae bacterium]
MSNYNIKIMHLYPDLLNLYGDKGNIACMQKRLEWRNIDAEVIRVIAETDDFDISSADIIFLGGGAERENKIVYEKLKSKSAELSGFIENGGTLVAMCDGFAMLGSCVNADSGETEGLGIIDISTIYSKDAKKVIGNAVIACDGLDMPVVGFENHGGMTDIKNHTPLGKVIKGGGADGKGEFEGIVYKNLTGTYLHGPLFPKNPHLCDRILLATLTHKYGNFDALNLLDDSIEIKANEYMINRP